MKSREYYSQIEKIIRSTPINIHFSIDFDEIDLITGYLRAAAPLERSKGAETNSN